MRLAFLTLGAAALIAGSAFADPTITGPLKGKMPPPGPAADPNKVTLVVTPEEANIIGMGVEELPFKIAQPVLADLQRQLMAWKMVHDPAPDGPLTPAPKK